MLTWLKNCMGGKAGGKLVVFLFSISLLLFSLASLCVGPTQYGFKAVLAALANRDPYDPLFRILLHVRLPRVLGAILAGSSLAVSGAILQTVLNNPLAGPNVIGINSGAGLAVLTAGAFFHPYDFLQPILAFGGALVVAGSILLISAKTKSRMAIVLTGFGISSICSAGMNIILILYPDAYLGSSAFLVGGLGSLVMQDLLYPALIIIPSLILAGLLSSGMHLLLLGEEKARSLGVNVQSARMALVATAAALSGGAVSFAGLLSFVGFVVPHGVRLLLGQNNRHFIPLSAVTGALFVSLCDMAARTLFAPYEIPVGIILSFAGAPAFIFLLIHNRRVIYDDIR